MPATQSAHSFWPELGCTVPGLHSLCAREPVEHEEPAGQLEHALLLPSPGVLLNVPSLHGSGAEAPCSQYEPGMHSKHAVWPLSFMNLPTSQLAQIGWALAGCTVPGLHSVGLVAPVEQKAPSGQAGQSFTVGMSERSPPA